MKKYICYATVGVVGFIVGRLATQYQVVMTLANSVVKTYRKNDSKEDKS